MSSGNSTLRGLLIGVVVGLVVLALAIGGVQIALSSGGGGSSPSPGPSSEPSSEPSPAPATVPTPSGPMPATDPRLARFYDQSLAWRPCGGGECTEVTVPVDYAKPDGATVRLAVLRVPPGDPKSSRGDLFINPGGPGGSGIQYAQASFAMFRPQLTDHYAVVGFDPRGVGQSDPLKCLDTKQLDAYVASDPGPTTIPGLDRVITQTEQFGQACLRNSGDLVRHVSTVEVARDLDILRGAMRQPKLNYFGASYGTFIGATYANLFPKHVGRMVLDGALDPSLSNLQLNLQQAHGFEVALRSYVANCVSQAGCVLGTSVDQGVRRVQQLLAQVQKRPLPTDSSRQLTVGLATLGVWMPLYAREEWGQLTAALNQAITQHRGTALLALADIYTSRGPSGYTDDSLNALQAVNCLDNGQTVSPQKVRSYYPEFEKASPTFGIDFADSLLSCNGWPAKGEGEQGPLHAKGAPPIVVVGTTRDPATPVAWARALARMLDSGVLVTRNGDGHTGYNHGNLCTDLAVEHYLVDGTVPRNGLAC